MRTASRRRCRWTDPITLGSTGRKTGFWLEEFAAPYYAFRDAGAQVALASPRGGQPPLDPKSDEPDAQTDAPRRFKADAAAQAALAATAALSTVRADDFDAVFYPGGHGPLWDLAEDTASIALIERAIAAGKPVAAVCHAPGVLRRVKSPDGQAPRRGGARSLSAGWAAPGGFACAPIDRRQRARVGTPRRAVRSRVASDRPSGGCLAPRTRRWERHATPDDRSNRLS